MALQAVPLEEVEVGGDLGFRLNLSFDRLQSEPYQAAQILQPPTAQSWPGDWIGRAILALTLLQQATGREAGQLHQIVAALPEHLNERGYLGPIEPEGVLNEQQISGHAWLVRGLAEYHLATEDEGALRMLARIAENLLLPARGLYEQYPIDRAASDEAGGQAGDLLDEPVDGWRVSTDVGCAFIALNAAVQAYELLEEPGLKALSEEMISRFLQMDPAAVGAQTHATLSALRGMLRYCRATGSSGPLHEVERLYRLYRSEAMTENYANYNWFGRPEWTEPCAVVDSLMVAVGLWRQTGNPDWLEDAHHVYYNALCPAQRPNGGFGCDTCVGAEGVFLETHLYEAPWCCTMRGAVGLARAAQWMLFCDDHRMLAPFFFTGSARVRTERGQGTLKLQTDYPHEGRFSIEVTDGAWEEEEALKLFAPSWMLDDTVRLTVNGTARAFGLSDGFLVVHLPLRAGDSIEVECELLQCAKDTMGENNLAGYHTFRHGPLLLGCSPEGEIRLGRDAELARLHKARYEIEGRDLVLSPINDVARLSEESAGSLRRQVIFR